MKVAFLFIAGVLFGINTFAQTPPSVSQTRLRTLYRTDAAYKLRTDNQNATVSAFAPTAAQDATQLKIPVIIHIFHKGEPLGTAPNFTDAQVTPIITKANALLANANGAGVNTQIEVQLAKRAPDCQATTGINRINAASVPGYTTYGLKAFGTQGADELALKNLSRWNPANYLNIWIVTEIDNNNGAGAPYSLAHLPAISSNLDGIVIQASAFNGSIDQTARILLREIGLYLSLFNTFEAEGCAPFDPKGCGAFLGDCCTDTDPHPATLSGCPTANTNPYTGLALGNVVKNYMDYSAATCADRFTAQQKKRMRATLFTVRSSLLNSNALTPPSGANVASAQCTPPATAFPASSDVKTGVFRVQLAGLDFASNSRADEGIYLDQSCTQNVNLNANTNYSITVTTGADNLENAQVWIDYNGNGQFNAPAELILASNAANIHQLSFTTPTAPVLNQPVRMRVISDIYTNPLTTACYAPVYGQVEDFSVTFGAFVPSATFQAKIFLQGAYTSNAMRTDLNDSGLLPINQPYNNAPYNYNGTESNNAFLGDVVDWVLVELRDPIDISSVIERKAGVVLSNGQLAAANGVSPLQFSSPAGNYNVTVKHRNHLSLTSAQTISLPVATPFDFTNLANIAGGAAFAANLGSSRYGMIAGDYNSDGFISASDYSQWQIYNSQFFVYVRSDGNMDGFVTVTDYAFWQQNNSKFSYTGD